MMSWRVADNVLAYSMENGRWGEIAWGGRLRTVDRKEQSLCNGRMPAKTLRMASNPDNSSGLRSPAFSTEGNYSQKSRISRRSKCARTLKYALAFHYVDDKKGSYENSS